jgi:hypothetical protein
MMVLLRQPSDNLIERDAERKSPRLRYLKYLPPLPPVTSLCSFYFHPNSECFGDDDSKKQNITLTKRGTERFDEK